MIESVHHPSADLVLAAYNGRYTHTSLGVRWLLANLGDDPPATAWHEFDLRVPAADAAHQILAHRPRLVALGVYIWNAQRITQLMRQLRTQRPKLLILLGGPEVSAAPDTFSGIDLADLVLTGEAEAIFGEWCRLLLAGHQPVHKVVAAPAPDLAKLKLPYYLYSEHDLQTRHIYVETTRGCPHRCDFCVSGCADGIRTFPLDPTIQALKDLARRGARTLRLVDRTFNARPGRGARLLHALRPWAAHGLRLHLEFTPQIRYREDLQAALCAWPPGVLHIELGVQTFNPAVARRVRRPGVEQEAAALDFLLHTARAEVHADLIAGLPGEDWASIAESFDRLIAHQPHELQFGILKNLPGTALERHRSEWGLTFDPHPPYSLQSSRTLSPGAVTRLKRFAAYWDRLGNRRTFPKTLSIILRGHRSPFAAFMHCCDWLFAGFGRTHHLDLADLCTALYAYLTVELRHPPAQVRAALVTDFLADGRRPQRALPPCLRPPA